MTNMTDRTPCKQLIWLCLFGLGIGQAKAVNETPRSATAVLFQPCAWQFGSSSGPLKSLATSQNYTYTEYTNTTGARPAGTLPATLDAFVGLSTTGILEIETHGAGDNRLQVGGIQIECYPLAEEAAGRARYKRICDGVDRPGGIQFTCDKNPKKSDILAGSSTRTIEDPNGNRTEKTNFGILLTPAGLKKVYQPSPHSIVFNGACHGFTLAPAFAGVEYLGYLGCVYTHQSTADTQKIFRRLSGNELAGHARSMGGHNHRNRPNQTCTAFGYGSLSNHLYHTGPGNTTVAPAVAYAGADLLGGCKNGTYDFTPRENTTVSFPGGIVGRAGFDTVMDTTIDPWTIFSAGGCGGDLRRVEWIDDHSILFHIWIEAGGTLQHTLANGQSLSLHNHRELDGNQNPAQQKGVGPNRDNYVSQNTCGAGLQSPEEPSVGSFRSFQPLVADFSFTVVDAVVGVGGADLVEGSAELSSTESVSAVSLEASDLISGGNVILGDQVIFMPGFVDMTAGVAEPVSVFVSIPFGQPSGTYTGTVTASDGALNTEQFPFTVHVNGPPLFSMPEAISLQPGQPLSIALSATDPEGDAIAFLSNVLPTGAVLFDYGDGTGLVDFVPDPETPGGTFITVQAFNPSVPGSIPPSTVATVAISFGTEPSGGGGPPIHGWRHRQRKR